MFKNIAAALSDYLAALKKTAQENKKAIFVWAVICLLLGAAAATYYADEITVKVSQFFAAPAPASLQVTCTSNSAVLSWNIPSGATVNTLQRDNGTGWQVIFGEETMVTTTFTDSPISPDQRQYKYRVKSDPAIASNTVTCGGAVSATPTPPGALPGPDHAIDFGYYYSDGKYGDNFSEVSCYTNLYHTGRPTYVSDLPPSEYYTALGQSLSRAAGAGKRIIIELHMNQYLELLDGVLDTAKPYWNKVAYLELADEPDWDQNQTETMLGDLAGRLSNKGLARKPMGVVYTKNQILGSDAFLAPSLDWVGIEGYVDPPGSADSQTNVNGLNTYLDQAKGRVPQDKGILLIMQAYDRNGAWTNIATLKDIQIPVYLSAYRDPRVFAIKMFAYGRPGGTKDHPELKESHQQIATALAMNNCSAPLPTPTPGGTVTPTPTPIGPTPTPLPAPGPNQVSVQCVGWPSARLNLQYTPPTTSGWTWTYQVATNNSTDQQVCATNNNFPTGPYSVANCNLANGVWWQFLPGSDNKPTVTVPTSQAIAGQYYSVRVKGNNDDSTTTTSINVAKVQINAANCGGATPTPIPTPSPTPTCPGSPTPPACVGATPVKNAQGCTIGWTCPATPTPTPTATPTVTSTPLITPTPTATPTSLQLNAFCTGGASPRVLLNWAPISGATLNIVERDDGAIVFEEPVPPFSTFSYADTQVDPNATYRYRVVYDPVTTSNIVSITTSAAACAGTGPTPTPTSPLPTTTPTSTPSGTLLISIVGRNVTQSGSATKTTAAEPGDIVEFKVQVQASVLAQNLLLTTALPFGLTYQSGSTKINGLAASDGVTAAGISLGTIPAAGTTTVLFTTKVVAASAFTSGSTVMPITATVSGSGQPVTTDTAFVKVVVGSAGPQEGPISLSKLGRNITRQEAEEKTSVSASPGDAIEFVIRIKSQTGTTIPTVTVSDALPSGISYVVDSTSVDDIPVGNELTTTGGLNLGELAPGQERVLRFEGEVASADLVPKGLKTFINTAQVSATGVPSFIAQLPIVVTNGNIVGAGQSQTGTGGNSVFLALLVSSLVTFMYVAYTRTAMFAEKEVRTMTKQRPPSGEDVDFKDR